MDEQILEYVRKHRGVTFVELVRHVGDAARGDRVMELEENRLAWAYVSEEFIQAINRLLKADKIEVTGSSVLPYLFDGGMLNFPVAKSRRRYKTPHWVPVVLNPVDQSSQAHKACKRRHERAL